MKNRILIAFGTRPEAIKFVSLIKALRSSEGFKCFVCLTGQHREMLDQVIHLFKIKIDVDLNLMQADQTLEHISGAVMAKFSNILRKTRPDLVFVQGDTTTALISAISSFYSKIQIAHLEAGLRTKDKYHPFPEEINRRLISHLADYHFTPTGEATQNLLKEGVPHHTIFQVGNTVVDAIKIVRPLIQSRYSIFNFLNPKKRILFVTAHRRESFGKGLNEIFLALKMIARRFEDVAIVYPVHLNPRVLRRAREILNGVDRIHLLRPLTYEEACWIMARCFAILTDSGGIQEEAPSFRKPVLVLRNVTERPEGVRAGISKVVGTERNSIVYATAKLLTSTKHYHSMVATKNPYGDGRTAERILSHLKRILK